MRHGHQIPGQIMPLALYALTAGAFGIGVTEFVIVGLLLEVGADCGGGTVDLRLRPRGGRQRASADGSDRRLAAQDRAARPCRRR